MSQGLEKLRAYTAVLGSSKDNSKAVFEHETGLKIKTYDPEKEVLGFKEKESDNPNDPAKQKGEAVMNNYEREGDEEIAVLTADVIAVREGEHSHKDSRYEGYALPLMETVSRVAAETAYCYEPFVFQWVIGLTLQTPDRKIETQFTIQGEYHSPLAYNVVENSYSPHMNSQVPLVEQGKVVNSNFYWVEADGTKLPMTQSLAEQLVVHRVLPLPLFLQFIEGLASEVEQQDWQFMYLNYREFLQQAVAYV